MFTVSPNNFTTDSLQLPPLPLKRPLLTIGHGTRDFQGREDFLNFSQAYQALDTSRPVVPCFLELTNPSIQEGIDYCVARGYSEISVLPILYSSRTPPQCNRGRFNESI